MLNSKLAHARLVALAAVAGITCVASPAASQTAVDLQCRGCVGKTDLGKKAVVSRHIKNGSVKTKKITDGAITAEKIGDGTVTAEKIVDGAVTGSKISDSAVEARHLGADATPAGVAFGELDVGLPLDITVDTVFSLEVDAPGPGFIQVSADFTANFDDANAHFICHLEQDGVRIGLDINGRDMSGMANNYIPAAMIRVGEVSAAGPTTFTLDCLEGVGGDVRIFTPTMTALFVPARY